MSVCTSGADGLGEDHHGDRHEDQGVGEGGQDLGTLVAVGPQIAGRPGSDPCGQERDEDARGVGEHVPGVREQCQGSRQGGPRHLNENHGHRDGQDGD